MSNLHERALEVLPVEPGSPHAYVNRELSWLAFARRVLALAEDPDLPVLERVKFAGIVGMLHDEFFMKRVGGIKRQIIRSPGERSADGRTPEDELAACREEILTQMSAIGRVVEDDLRPALAAAGVPVLDIGDVSPEQRDELSRYFTGQVLPVLTPLAIDAEHPFPFISNQGLNLAVQVYDRERPAPRIVRLKVPTNRPRWVPLASGGFVPLEQVIGAHLDRLFPDATSFRAHLFRVTRGAEGDAAPLPDELLPDADQTPGSIVHHVTKELKARRFAGVVRLKVAPDMPDGLRAWLAGQLGMSSDDVYATRTFLGLADLLQLKIAGHPELHDAPHEPVDHPRLKRLKSSDPAAIFGAIAKGDILLHHPYHSFDTSVLRFIQSASADPQVLAIKLTIYRTSTDSPIVRALAEAARRDKQVAVLVEITARFDEAPNIAWGDLLEKEGVHVSYGVRQLKTHVKLALVVRAEEGGIRRYAHVGSGNYHPGTARLYEDVGLLTCDPDVCEDVAATFNQLTGAIAPAPARRLIVAPYAMRDRFTALIRREAAHAREGRPSGIRAKMNQLQDGALIRELYAAGAAGVPVTLIVRGLCCLRPGVPGLSENIRVFGVVGRFLEHSRIYAFANGGDPELFIGSADWMKRNLDRRVESIAPVADPRLKRRLAAILDAYEIDNASVWDCRPDGVYVRRRPAPGEPKRAVQDMFTELARKE